MPTPSSAQTRRRFFVRSEKEQSKRAEAELGFVPFDRAGGELLFNLLTERYERRSVIVTTNLAFGEWVKVFAGDEKLTSAPRHGHRHQGQELQNEEESYEGG